MKWKESSRSPNYGRIFAYDKNGSTINELDILKLVVVSNGKEYKLNDLFALIPQHEALLSELTKVSEEFKASKKQIEQYEQQIEILSDLMGLINLRIKALENQMR